MSVMDVCSFCVCFILLCASHFSQSLQNLMELNVQKLVMVSCNQRAELHCDIISSTQLMVSNITWLDPTETVLCTANDSIPTDGPLCTYKKGEQLVLHLQNVTPATQGTYTCKIRSNAGVKSNNSVVQLQECYTNGLWSSSGTEVSCWFPGVYPKGTIHWFSGDNNVTAQAEMNPSQANMQGMFNVSSTLHNAQPEESYSCQLWIPTTGVTLAAVRTEGIHSAKSQHNLGLNNRADGLDQQLLWVLLLASIMME